MVFCGWGVGGGGGGGGGVGGVGVLSFSEMVRIFFSVFYPLVDKIFPSRTGPEFFSPLARSESALDSKQNDFKIIKARFFSQLSTT